MPVGPRGLAAHLRCLSTLQLAYPSQQIAFQEYLRAISEAIARIARLEAKFLTLL